LASAELPQPLDLNNLVNSTIVERNMLYWAAVFFVIALIAALFGFSGIAGGAASIAQILFFVFIVLFVLSLIFGRRGRIG
jgi:uncharacterized membrane protein YtjA (UPF0391 family)